jgi:hypothetical protein
MSAASRRAASQAKRRQRAERTIIGAADIVHRLIIDIDHELTALGRSGGN